MNKIGYLYKILGYKYNNNINVLENIELKDENKKYALINMTNITYHYNGLLLRVISLIKNIKIKDNEIKYDLEELNEEVYIIDYCNFCESIKNKFTLENIYNYPQFIIEYTDKLDENIHNFEAKLLYHNEMSRINFGEINKLQNEINELQKRVYKLEKEEKKNIDELHNKKINFIYSEL